MNTEIIYFSIIIPLYNKEKSISKTVESVLNQRYENFELIIVNDGSTDNSFEIAKQFKDKRIKFIDKKNEGVSSARNKGIEMSDFKWICFLDADDIFLPNHLETYVNLIEKYPNYNVFTTHHAQSKKYIKSINKDFVVNDFLLENSKSFARTSQPICCVGTVVIYKDCFDEVGSFNLKSTHGEDLEMWYKLSLKYKFVKSYIVTFYYNQLAENRATNNYTKTNIDFMNKKFHSFYSLNLYTSYYVFLNIIEAIKLKRNPLNALKNAPIFFVVLYILYLLVYRLKYKFQLDTQIFMSKSEKKDVFFFEN